MKGLMMVTRTLMYQVGWTTKKPFRFFLNLHEAQQTSGLKIYHFSSFLVSFYDYNNKIREYIYLPVLGKFKKKLF